MGDTTDDLIALSNELARTFQEGNGYAFGKGRISSPLPVGNGF
jgi:hypothetical protein